MKQFILAESCRQMPCIQGHDLTLAECQIVERVITNQWIDSTDYKAVYDSRPFLQGYHEPKEGRKDGWVLVEFWSKSSSDIEQAIRYINQELQCSTAS